MADFDETRLSKILTNWTLVLDAHRSNSNLIDRRNELLLRYHKPIYKYAIAILRNNGISPSQLEDMATDFCNGFALKFLEGAFKGARKEKGSFRKYIKTAIRYDLWRLIKEKHQEPADLPENLAADEEADEVLRNSWRETIVNNAWDALADSHRRYYEILQLRMFSPEFSAQQIADEYEVKNSAKLSKENVRKIIEKARKKLASLILNEVVKSMEEVDSSKLESELKSLDLTGYCGDAFVKWQEKNLQE